MQNLLRATAAARSGPLQPPPPRPAEVADITRTDVAKLITGMAETPAMANKVISLLSKAFNLAEVWAWRPEGTNPCRHVDRYKEESRERFLSEDELHRLGDALLDIETNTETSPHAIAAIRLLVLTGCRSAKILSSAGTRSISSAVASTSPTARPASAPSC